MSPERLLGCLLGTAVGDALGLPYEGLPPRRVRYRGRHSFLFGRGMVSDDTEHTLIVLQALWEAEGDVQRFQRSMARQLRTWFLMLPAGVGLATLKACFRLLVGIPPERSGVASAGNGPAMRAAIIGCFYSEDPARRRAFVESSSRITHTDVRVVEGAHLVALAASYRANGQALSEPFLVEARDLVVSDEWGPILEIPRLRSEKGGVSGYVISSVEAALAVCTTDPSDFSEAMREIIAAGGDTDSTAAMVGGILGSAGQDQVPDGLVEGLLEWPRGVKWMTRLAGGPVKTFWPGVLLRNLIFLVIVLGHGLRRLLPPY